MNAATQSAARPTASVDRAELLRAIGELDLVSAEDLAAVHDDDPAQFAQTLVQQKKLTPYQAGALLGGKARGLLIGPYLVLEKLGSGGMGLVLKAQHRPSGRVVALKMLPPSFGRDPDVVRRFRREFQIAGRLKHPNLVAAIEASEDRGIHYLTMEYIPGYDLDTLVSRGGPMELTLALHCVIQAARGLEAAHAQGVIHRDVKPGNLMIDPNGAVRVLDLGLARVIEATTGFSNQSGTLTQTGSYMGTIDFLAPEQANDAKTADVRADIYSLACTLYFLLTAQPPFTGDTVLKRLMAHQDRPAPSLRAARPEVSEALENVYLKMMSKCPADRPRTMSEVILALESSRTSAREAGDASVDLKTFARTIMKRAPVRGRRGADASVFARPAAKIGGMEFDPDLCFEDLVADYREELHHGPLDEDKLPPLHPKARPVRKKRRKRIHPALIGLAGAVVLGVAGFFLFPRDARKPVETTRLGFDPKSDARFAESIGIKIVPIPSGEFGMGMSDSEIAAALKESPSSKREDIETQHRHRVRLTRLQGLSAHEITIGQFRRFVEDSGYQPDSERGGNGNDGNEPVKQKSGKPRRPIWGAYGVRLSDNHPVACVTWKDATEFCRWLSRKDGRTYRLPTEAEWEYCCRAGTQTLFSNGADTQENILKIGNMADAQFHGNVPDAAFLDEDDGYETTAPVGRYAPNAWGLYDMNGNVWEWCQDFHDDAYYAASPPIDPPGPETGSERVLRGGSWFDIGVPSATRHRFMANGWVPTIGFRVALDRSPPPLRIATPLVFRPLFNGENFNGWLVPSDATIYTIANGEILLKPHGNYEFLTTDRAYANFVLKAKVKMSRGNTGIQIRSRIAPEHQATGVQVDIFQDGGCGMLYDRENWKSLRPYREDKARLAFKPGNWNDLEIIAVDRRVVTKLNGAVVTDLVVENLPESGVIALEPDNPKESAASEGREPEAIRFKEIAIAELPGPAVEPPNPLMAGKLLYVDEFNNPATKWPDEGKERAGQESEHHWGYAKGTYRLDANAAAPFAWGPGNSFHNFYCEAVGRVVGDSPASVGSMMVEFPRTDFARGFQLRLTNRGEVYLEQSFHVFRDYKGAYKTPGIQSYGPIRNPAIRVGKGDLNKLGIRRVGKTVEVFVNGTSVLGPVPIEWAGPVTMFLGVAADVPNIRAEFERVEVHEVPGPVIAADPAPPPKPAVDPVAEALERRIDLNFQRAPLGDVLNFFHTLTVTRALPQGIPISVDNEGLRKAGQSTLSSVDITTRATPLKDGLRDMLTPLRLKYVVRDGKIVITSR
jgi:serine/threonine-protein kinase